MGSDMHFRDKIPVAILGATGTVGQKFIELLSHHPWFEITALAASERSVGKPYKEAVNWLMATPLPKWVGDMIVQPCKPNLGCILAFSGLDSSVAGEVETAFAEAGVIVVSNSKNHRMDPAVPLLIPEVNPNDLDLLAKQTFAKGKIVTNPNCTAVGLTLTLKPLFDRFGLETVHMVSFQAISGAGYPGVPALDIVDNIIPFIRDEEDKVETEPLKILGDSTLRISAQCNRVAVNDGHLECVSVKLKKKASEAEIIEAWRSFKSEPQALALPSAPEQPIHYFEEENYPQPKLHRLLDKGMAVSIGRLRPCPLFDFKFALLSHNTIRGAAGGAILNAELMLKRGLIYW